MTPEQKARIKAAAGELASAMTEAGDYFDVTVTPINVTQMQSKSERWAYEIFIKVTTKEVIA